MIDEPPFALDTAIIAYSEGVNDDARWQKSIDVIDGVGPRRFVLPTQVAGEFYNVLTRKLRLPAGEAAQRTSQVMQSYTMRASMEIDFVDALALSSRHNLQFWDALILATAANAGCALLLTEDMHDGFVWKGCTVANPFADPLHPLLKDALER